ncbi:MAG: peptidylprolyl isomerase [Spirochaetes bacterium]|nr:MAG: peptidylprolyl isomerase [Spirochaetota bacterium]
MVKENDYVVVHYTGTFEGGEVFDTSADRDPLEFQVGAGSVIPGFEQAVMGMKPEEEKRIILQPGDAYGERDEAMMHAFPLAEVRQQFEPEVGMTIGVATDEGQHMPALITEITDTEVKLDLNHPLAGKTLVFDIKLIEINDAPKYGSGCDSDSCGGGCSCC